jgi:hypothetical protein
MNLDFFTDQELDDFDYLAMAQQVRQIGLAFESIKAMCGPAVVALPLYIDKVYVYWCATAPIGVDQAEVLIIATSYETQAAGGMTILTTKRIKNSPKIRRILKDRITNLRLHEDLNDKVEKLSSQIPGITIPKDLRLWLREVRSVI